MKKILFVLFSLFLFLPICDAVISCNGFSDYSYINFEKEYENGADVTGAEFTLYNIDRTKSIVIPYEDNIYSYLFITTMMLRGENNIAYSDAFITSTQKEWMNSIHSYEDIENYYNTGNYTVDYSSYNNFKESMKNSNGIEIGILNQNNHESKGEFYSFAILEETKTPIGYKKEVAIVPIVTTYRFIEDEFVELKVFPISYVFNDTGCDNYLNAFLLKYSKDIDYTNFYETLTKLDDSYLYPNTCNIPFTIGGMYAEQNNILGYNKNGTCYQVITNIKGEPAIEASATLNNKKSIKVNEESVVSYKLNVTNTSDTSTGNTVIKSVIPSKINYVPNSASHNGVYNQEDNSVTWTIDYLNAEETIELTYDVRVSDGENKTYEFITSLTNDEVQNIPNISNNLETEFLKNPKTGDITRIVILLVLVVSLLAFHFIYNKSLITKI